jgi:hypothetical protein
MGPFRQTTLNQKTSRKCTFNNEICIHSYLDRLLFDADLQYFKRYISTYSICTVEYIYVQCGDIYQSPRLSQNKFFQQLTG